MKPVAAANGSAAAASMHTNGTNGAIGVSVKSAQHHLSGASRARQIVASAAAATAQTSTSQTRGRGANNANVGGGPSARNHSVPYGMQNQR